MTEEEKVIISIPDTLQDGSFRFIRLHKGQKEPLDNQWQKVNNFSFNDPEIISHLKNGGNYGVICSSNDVCILDADEFQRLKEIGALSLFEGQTFTVRTGNDKTERYHYFFRCKGLKEKKIPFYDLNDEKLHLGELYPTKSKAYCVGAGSVHPSGKTYDIVCDKPIKEISLSDLESCFLHKVKSTYQDTTREKIPDFSRYERNRDVLEDILDLRIEEFGFPDGDYKYRANGEIQGANPIFGSTTGMNYSINPYKGIYHDFRHGTGGRTLKFIAIKHGFIEQTGNERLCDNSYIELKKAIREGLLGQDRAKKLIEHEKEEKRIWKESEDKKIKALAEANAKAEAEESGIEEAPGLKEIDDRNQITTWIHNRSKNQILESGIFYNKDKKAVQGAGDIREVLRDICVNIIFSGKNGDSCISELSIINKSLSDKLSLSELQKIKIEAYQVVKYLKYLDESKRDEQTKVSEVVRKKAQKIIDERRIKQEFKKQYARIHASDERIAEIILHGFILQALDKPDVIIHPILDGEKGAGKSSGVDAAMHLLPDEYVIGSGFSMKALFYHAIRDKSVIYLDDAVWKEELGSYIKTYMNDVSKGTPYRTLDTDRKAITLNFPIGCMFIASSVLDSGDDQLLDRQYRISVRKDDDKAKKHNALITGELVTGQVRRLFIDDDILAMREALRIYRRADFIVIAPDAVRLEFSHDASSRDKEMFKVFLRSVIILNYQQRPHKEQDGVIEVTSSGDDFKADFKEALNLFDLNKDQRKHKLNDSESKVLSAILNLKERGSVEITREAIMQEAGISKTSLSYALNGRKGVGGLFEKIPLLEESQVSKYDDDNKKTKHYNIIRYSGDINLQTALNAWFVKLN